MLSPEARGRLARIELANPKLVERVETLIAYMYQSGQLQGRLSDEQLKAILSKISETRRRGTIRRK